MKNEKNQGISRRPFIKRSKGVAIAAEFYHTVECDAAPMLCGATPWINENRFQISQVDIRVSFSSSYWRQAVDEDIVKRLIILMSKRYNNSFSDL